MIIEILLAIAWLFIGFFSFVYWWTKEYDFTVDELPAALVTSLLGPISFVFGWSIHGKSIFSNKIIVKKR